MHLPLNFNVKKVFDDLKAETKEVDEMSVSQEDAKILDMTRHEGWKAYEEEVERRITALKNFVDPEGQALIDADGDPSLVGVKYLMVAFAIYHMRQAINIPQSLIQYERLQQEKQKGNK